MTKVMLKPAIQPYRVSAVAAPRPETSPDRQPFASVREMQRTFTGPTGAAMNNPASNPLKNSSRASNLPFYRYCGAIEDGVLLRLPLLLGRNFDGVGSVGNQANLCRGLRGLLQSHRGPLRGRGRRDR